MQFKLWLAAKMKERQLTQRQLAERSGISPGTVSRWLKGEFEPDFANLRRINRALKIPEKEFFLELGLVSKEFFEIDQEDVLIPVIGSTVPCGIPGDDIEAYIEGYEVFKKSLLPFSPAASPGDGLRLYLIRARGESMKGDGIRDRDRVLFTPDLEVHPGEIGLVHVDQDGFAIKRVFFHGETIVLQSSNPDYPPMIIDGREQQVRIVGKVVMHIGYHTASG